MTSRRRSAFAARLVSSASPGEAPRVLEDLRSAIVSGSQPPGTLIPIDSVAAFFGVSQIPVREALMSLIGEGLVEHVPRVGYSVAKLTYGELVELYEVRRALETAALRFAVGRAEAGDDTRAGEAHARMRAAIDAEDERLYHEASRDYHLALIRASGMMRLLHQYESAWNLTEPARPMARVPDDRRRLYHDDHADILEAFLARDLDAVLARMAQHYDHLLAGIAALASDPEVFRQG